MDKIMHISVFSENKPGKIEKITRIFAQEGINILASSISSSNDFGIIKLFVDKCELALEKLKQNGFTVTLNEVLAVEMKDCPGGLYEVSRIFARKGINIENAYVYVTAARGRSFLLVEVKDIEKTKELLAGEKLTFLKNIEFM